MATNPAVQILVVDDESYVAEVLFRWLTDEGYQCDTASSGEAALTAIGKETYAVVLLDHDLPGMSGADVLAVLHDQHPEISALMVTGVDDREKSQRCIELGAYAYLVKPFDQREMLINVAGALEDRSRKLEAIRAHGALEQKVRARGEDTRHREEEIALRLVAAAEYRDEETHAHIRRIGMFAEILARALGWDPQAVDDIRIAAPMHDVGKIGIPDGILLKPGKLAPEEYEVIKLHTEIGARMLADSDIPLLQMAEEIARSHHERWDGAGYPRGLKGEAIPSVARIVAIADVWDSLTHDRSYRPAFSEERALLMMRDERGKHFDPAVFDVFVETLPAFRRVARHVADEVHETTSHLLEAGVSA